MLICALLSICGAHSCEQRFPKHSIKNNSLQEKLNVAKIFSVLFGDAWDGTLWLCVWQVFALSTKLTLQFAFYHQMDRITALSPLLRSVMIYHLLINFTHPFWRVPKICFIDACNFSFISFLLPSLYPPSLFLFLCSSSQRFMFDTCFILGQVAVNICVWFAILLTHLRQTCT